MDAKIVDEPRRGRVSGIERSVQILDTISEIGKPVSAYEIAKKLGAPRSTVYSVVDELCALNLLYKSDDNLIWLGPRMLRYGLMYESRLDLLDEAKREMERLAGETGETIQICLRDEGHMIVTAMADGKDHFRIASEIGTRVPLNWTASGRLLLGHLPFEERVIAFRNFAKPSPTNRAEMDATKLAKQSGEDFANKLAVQLGASEFSVACIASPILNKAGECIATISIVMPESKARDNLDIYSDFVRKSSSNIEHMTITN